jgi:ATP-dependent helicase/nuclease subunit A
MAVSRGGAIHPLMGAQRDASDPRRHVWLSASAGTGKTQVLAARVFRLLLHGARPEAILCLTFTKAGAAEMAERINATLARWVRLEDERLFAELRALGEPGDPEQRQRARTLFARVLDATGGLRIQTIHSFCQSLLAAFPAEAGLAPGFRPVEAREEAVLLREALARMLEDEAREGRSAVADAIGRLSLRLGEGGAEEYLHVCARKGAAMLALPGGGGIRPWLWRTLGIPHDDVEAEIVRCCGDDVFDMAGLAEMAALNAAWGTKRADERNDRIAAWRAADGAERARTLNDLVGAWANQKGGLFAGKGWAPPGDDWPPLAERMHERCSALMEMRRLAAFGECLAEALEAGRAYAIAYAEAKRRAGAVDFNDLIERTVRLLETPGMGEWVRYKLDQGVEHVLVDEAQDTNWDQWRIVRALADEFFAGSGAAGERVRTLFTVGDYKQAIYGFQGTDPVYFRGAERHFDALSDVPADFGEARRLDRLSLTHSFRSTATVLQFVDAAVEAMPVPGMGALCAAEAHVSNVPGPGSVTLLPPVRAGGSDEDEEGWIDDATRELAKRIARRIRQMLDDGHMLGAKGRPLRPQDVMILVKRRGELAALIVARLYAEGVPVAGIDRLRLNAPIAVQDLLAAVRFVLQPEDDLNLASLLVSPLIGWSQDQLMTAALNRGQVSLWRHLRAHQSAEALAPLNAMLARADLTTPYRFLEELLSGELDGRRRLLERLGEEARDPIEELLNAALNFEGLATPSLQRFVDWFDRGDVDVVRDSSRPQAAVRVMTAHGAKGLQAPLVILADATIDPDAAQRRVIDWQPEGAGGIALPIFRPRAEERAGPLGEAVAVADAREMEEHWRLFYVAATRAEEQLIVAGALGPKWRDKGPPGMSWYACAARAMDALAIEADAEGERLFADDEPPCEGRAEPDEAEVLPSLPDWVRRPAPQEARPPRPLAPSTIGDDEVADPPPGPAMRAAAERGRLLHGLFERLGTVAAQDRRAAGERWLASQQGGPALVDDALAVIEHPDCAALFAPEALAEAPITAVVEGQVIAGTVDRLLVGKEVVRVVDFKTGRRVPSALDDLPVYHVRQMAAYAAALAVIFPGRRIEAALLYTAEPRLFTLPEGLIAAHKPRLPGGEQSLPQGA